jgi:hypothetical protein
MGAEVRVVSTISSISAQAVTTLPRPPPANVRIVSIAGDISCARTTGWTSDGNTFSGTIPVLKNIGQLDRVVHHAQNMAWLPLLTAGSGALVSCSAGRFGAS